MDRIVSNLRTGSVEFAENQRKMREGVATLREITFRFVRSSGPGGQNVNRVASKAVMRWNVRASESIADHAMRFATCFSLK